jgi:hypothetical protein
MRATEQRQQHLQQSCRQDWEDWQDRKAKSLELTRFRGHLTVSLTEVVHGKASRQTDTPRSARTTHRTCSEAFKREAVRRPRERRAEGVSLGQISRAAARAILDYIAAWYNSASAAFRARIPKPRSV